MKKHEKEGLGTKTCIIILNLRHAYFCKHVLKDNKTMKSRIPYVHADFKIFAHV